MEEKIINDRVDSLLVRIEGYFKEAVEKNKECQDELDGKVKALIDEHDEKEEVKKFVKVKDLVDFITLALSMPLEDSTKERIVEEIVRDIEDGTTTKEGV